MINRLETPAETISPLTRSAAAFNLRLPPALGRASRSKGVGNEAGMCPGINGFTNYAPIADWAKVKSWSSTGSAESPAFETLRLFSAETSHRPQSLQAAEFWKARLWTLCRASGCGTGGTSTSRVGSQSFAARRPTAESEQNQWRANPSL